MIALLKSNGISETRIEFQKAEESFMLSDLLLNLNKWRFLRNYGFKKPETTEIFYK